MHRRFLAALAAAGVLTAAGAASAQQTSVGVSAGTPGLGLELGYDFNDTFGLRANGNWFSLSKDVNSDDVAYDADVLDDGAVPLARVIPGRVDSAGATVPPRIVLYRRPLEARAVDDLDLDDLVHDVVVEQVASLLGMPPEEIDPSD